MYTAYASIGARPRARHSVVEHCGTLWLESASLFGVFAAALILPNDDFKVEM